SLSRRVESSRGHRAHGWPTAARRLRATTRIRAQPELPLFPHGTANYLLASGRHLPQSPLTVAPLYTQNAHPAMPSRSQLSAQCAEELADVVDVEIGRLVCREVAAMIVRRPVHDVAMISLGEP